MCQQLISLLVMLVLTGTEHDHVPTDSHNGWQLLMGRAEKVIHAVHSARAGKS